MTILPAIELEPRGTPSATVIVLHGLGADGNDFVPIVHELDLDGAPPIRFVFPHAPVMPVTINGGMSMPAWYDILGTDLVRREDEPGLRRSLQAVLALIARENERGIANSRIVLAGFSQGCAMALLAGLRVDPPLAGIVGLSGYLPLAASTAAERNPATTRTPVFLAHGIADPVVAIARGLASRDLLVELGYEVDWNEYPMAHSVCAPEIVDLGRFITEVLGKPA
ncbi:alpha/beta hydrolase [soil metagenome]